MRFSSGILACAVLTAALTTALSPAAQAQCAA